MVKASEMSQSFRCHLQNVTIDFQKAEKHTKKEKFWRIGKNIACVNYNCVTDTRFSSVRVYQKVVLKTQRAE